MRSHSGLKESSIFEVDVTVFRVGGLINSLQNCVYFGLNGRNFGKRRNSNFVTSLFALQ